METVKIVPINTITYMFMMIMMSLRVMITNPWQIMSEAIRGNYIHGFQYDEENNRFYPVIPLGFFFTNRKREVQIWSTSYLQKRGII